VLVRVTTGAGPGNFYFHSNGADYRYSGPTGFGGADVTWGQGAPISAGSTPDLALECDSASTAFDFTADLFDVPAVPTTFSGTSSYYHDRGGYDTLASGSTLYFAVPARAPYTAQLTLSQGAVKLDGEEVGPHDFASSGTYPLGSLSKGIHSLTLTPLDGAPAARWSVAVQSQPIAVSAVAFDRSTIRPSQISVAAYSLSADASVTATVNSAAGTIVRHLAASAAMATGAHTIRWDGFDDDGRPVADGSYTLRIDATDAAGNPASGQAPVTVDGQGPVATMQSTFPLDAQRALAIQVSDATSGLHSAQLYIAGKKVASLTTGQATLVYRPSQGWVQPQYTVRVVATDKAGNQSVRDWVARVKQAARATTRPQAHARLAAATTQLTSATASAAFDSSLIPAGAFVPKAEGPSCPAVEHNPGLLKDAYACMIEYRLGGAWHLVEAAVGQRHGRVEIVGKPYVSSWTRTWRQASPACVNQIGLKGSLRSNDGACDALMASDIEYAVGSGETPRYAYWHGTNTAGFDPIARYTCTKNGRDYRCVNSLGDAFIYTNRT
jgi:hypothetical protein